MLTRYKLGELVNVTRGMSLPGENYSEEGELVRLTLGNFDYARGGFKENTSKKDIYYTGDVKDEYILKKGDIITPLTEQTVGLLGSTAMIPESGKYIQSQDVALVTCTTDKIDPLFCYYLISSDIVRKQLSAAAQQTKIRHTSPDKIMDCVVWVPELSLQQKIGKTLYTIEKKISLNTRLNAELEAMAKQLYDYWFVQFDFPDENGNPYKSSGGKMVYNEKLKREIPEGWDVKTYGKVFDVKLGGTPSTFEDAFWENGTINWLNSGEVQNFPVNESEKKITDAAIKSSSTEFLPKGSVLISITRYLRVTILNIDACINQSVAGFAETDLFKYPYTYFALSAEVPRLMALRSGAQQPHINKETIEESPFLLPPNDILANYYTKASPIFELLFRKSEEKKELTHLRDSLLPMLMNGQVVVCDDDTLYHGTDVCMLEMSDEERMQFFADCKLVINSLYEQCKPIESYRTCCEWAFPLFKFFRNEKWGWKENPLTMFSKIEKRGLYLTNCDVVAEDYAEMAQKGGEMGLVAYTIIKKSEEKNIEISDIEIQHAIERIKHFVEDQKHEPIVIKLKYKDLDINYLECDEKLDISGEVECMHGIYFMNPCHNFKYLKLIDLHKYECIKITDFYIYRGVEIINE